LNHIYPKKGIPCESEFLAVGITGLTTSLPFRISPAVTIAQIYASAFLGFQQYGTKQ